MDAARIRKTEQEIESILPARDEYVINTSEYIDIRQRMISLEARKKAADAVEQPGDPDRPTVRRRDLVE
jgi:hypothetical protein